MRFADVGRKVLPWLVVVGGAAFYAWSLVTGGIGYRTESRAMPALTAARLDNGQAVTNQTLRGQPLILNVWAPYCAPCRHELPGLDKVAADYAGRVQIVGLMGWGTADEGREILRATGVGHLPLVAGDDAFLNALDVETVPTTFFIHADGTIVGRQIGMRGEGFFRDQAQKLLSGKL